MLNDLRIIESLTLHSHVQYRRAIRCIKIFLGYSRRDSVTSILFNLGLPSFETLMKNASVSYSRLQNCCSNPPSCAYVSAICVLTVITVVQLITLNFLSVIFLFLYVFSIFSVIVCLSCFMGLAA